MLGFLRMAFLHMNLSRPHSHLSHALASGFQSPPGRLGLVLQCLSVTPDLALVDRLVLRQVPVCRLLVYIWSTLSRPPIEDKRLFCLCEHTRLFISFFIVLSIFTAFESSAQDLFNPQARRPCYQHGAWLPIVRACPGECFALP